MPFERSPSLKDFAQGMPPKLPDSAWKQRRIRLAIVVLSLVLGGLILLNVTRSRVIERISGSGTVTGLVLDARGQPAVAEILIERTALVTQSDPSGRFTLPGVPVGQQLLVVAHTGVGVEYPIVAVAGASVDVGTMRVETTAVPVP